MGEKFVGYGFNRAIDGCTNGEAAGGPTDSREWLGRDGLDFKKLDMVPAVIQDAATGEVLMLGFMNAEAYAATQASGEVTFFSRSRNKLWRKGEQSGHVLRVREIRVDCDVDALLVRVDALGPGVCHEGYRSCFFRQLSASGDSEVVAELTFDPNAVYGKDSQR